MKSRFRPVAIFWVYFTVEYAIQAYENIARTIKNLDNRKNFSENLRAIFENLALHAHSS